MGAPAVGALLFISTFAGVILSLVLLSAVHALLVVGTGASYVAILLTVVALVNARSLVIEHHVM